MRRLLEHSAGIASRGDKARRVNARYPRTERAKGQNFRRISSGMRLKIRIRQFWRRGQAGSRKKGESTDRKQHRGDFHPMIRNWENGKDWDLETKVIIKSSSCVSDCTQGPTLGRLRGPAGSAQRIGTLCSKSCSNSLRH